MPSSGSRPWSRRISSGDRYAASTSVPACPPKRTVARWRKAGRCSARIHVGQPSRDGHDLGGVGAVDLLVAEVGTMAIGRLDPPLRRADRDADAVVLADQEQRQGQVLVGDADGGVDGTGRRRVVGRRVTEAAHHQRVGGPADRRLQLAGPADGEGHAQRPRQVGRDGRGLRDDRQVGVAEHLVAPAGHRFVGGGQHAPEHVGDRIVAGHLAGSGDVEPAAAVVEQGRVGRPERAGDGGVGLVARRADRVEATALRAQPAGGQVEVAARGLVVEQREGRRRRPAMCPSDVAAGARSDPAGREAGEVAEERFLHDVAPLAHALSLAQRERPRRSSGLALIRTGGPCGRTFRAWPGGSCDPR